MSEPASAAWTATSAWAVPQGRSGDRRDEVGVMLRLVKGVQLATLIVRRDCREALAAVIETHIGCRLPGPGGAAFGSQGDIIWSAPDQWLVVGKVVGLREACADLASITEQSSSRALIEVSGPRVRDALAKGFAIDLHPSVFARGKTAVTALAHMSVQIWQTDDEPRFMIAVPRSLAGSFWSWLDHACAAYGYEVTTFSG